MEKMKAHNKNGVRLSTAATLHGEETNQAGDITEDSHTEWKTCHQFMAMLSKDSYKLEAEKYISKLE